MATQIRKIFLICPVRDADEVLKKFLSDYVAKLEFQGYKVHYPVRDTEQADPAGGYYVCRINFTAMMNADEVHIWYDESSNGSKFDMGGLFMLHMLGFRKKIVIVNEGLILEDPEKQKSFLKVMRHFAQFGDRY